MLRQLLCRSMRHCTALSAVAQRAVGTTANASQQAPWLQLLTLCPQPPPGCNSCTPAVHAHSLGLHGCATMLSGAALPARTRAFQSCAAAQSSSSRSSGGGSIVSFPLAQTGEGISECELMQWFVKEGDVVDEFQPLCEVQSDKAAIEITSRYAGTIVCVHHAQGDVVKVGAPLVDIQTPGAAAGAADADAADAVPLTALGPAVPARGSSSSHAGGSSSSSAVMAAPTVRRLARELGVDLAQVAGSGPGGRVLKEDVEAHKAGLVSSIADSLVDRIAAKTGPATTAEMYAAAAEPRPASAVLEEEEAAATGPGATAAAPAQQAAAGAAAEASTRIPIRGYRRAMIKSATEAGAIPTFHYMDEVEVDGLLEARALLKADTTLEGAKLTYLPFIVKALSISLGRFPGLNTCLEPGGGALLQHHTHNIGVAMATSNGLVVPNIKQVESKSIPDVARELAHLQQLAAAGKLSSHDVTGGSITISNIGTVGGTMATPMLNPPEAAIVALGRVQALPRYDAATGELVRRHVMYVSWGGDHRVVDGAAVAEFSNFWKHLLQQPARLLMHLR